MEIRYKDDRPQYNKAKRPKPYQLLTEPGHIFVEIQHHKKYKNKVKTTINLAPFRTDPAKKIKVCIFRNLRVL